jgi:ABC-2 type transport system permease protein
VIRVRPYVAAAAVAGRHALSQRWDTLGRAGFYVVLLLVFAGLWRAVASSVAMPLAGPTSMLWYLALTEWIVLALPPVQQEVDDDVRTGDVAYQLTRPLSYAGAKVAGAIGTLLVRMAVLAPVGFGLAWALAGSLPPEPLRLVAAVPLAVGAAVVGTVFLVAIGMTAFWIQDSAPVFWIWQKMSFVLGGLILPIALYPGWLQALARWTPFHPLVSAPGASALGLEPIGAWDVAARIAAWGVVAALLLRALFRRGLRVLDVNGG